MSIDIIRHMTMPAEEGFSDIIGRMTSRSVKRGHYADDTSSYPTFRNAKEFTDAVNEGKCESAYGSYAGIIGGIKIRIPEGFTTDDAQLIDTCLVNLSKVANDIATDMCSRNHKPWAWDDEPDKTHTPNDVKKIIKIDVIAFYRNKNDGYDAEFWFNDGDLYYGHSLVADYTVENRKLTKIREFTVEG